MQLASIYELLKFVSVLWFLQWLTNVCGGFHIFLHCLSWTPFYCPHHLKVEVSFQFIGFCIPLSSFLHVGLDAPQSQLVTVQDWALRDFTQFQKACLFFFFFFNFSFYS